MHIHRACAHVNSYPGGLLCKCTRTASCTHTYGIVSPLHPKQQSQSNLLNETSGILPACGCQAQKQLGLYTHTRTCSHIPFLFSHFSSAAGVGKRLTKICSDTHGITHQLGPCKHTHGAKECWWKSCGLGFTGQYIMSHTDSPTRSSFTHVIYYAYMSVCNTLTKAIN